jgi:hypothetical protein
MGGLLSCVISAPQISVPSLTNADVSLVHGGLRCGCIGGGGWIVCYRGMGSRKRIELGWHVC